MKRTKNIIFWFVIAFIAVQAVIIFVNLPGKDRIALDIPNNRGIEELWTRGGRLIASELGGGYHIFDWNQLDSDCRTLKAAYDPSILLEEERILSVKDKKGLVFENSPGRSLWIPFAGIPAEVSLDGDPSCTTIILTRQFIRESGIEYRFARVDLKQEILHEICEVQGSPDFIIRKILIPDSQDRIILAGSKDKQACLSVIDLARNQVSWEKNYPEEGEFFTACFLKARNVIYAGSRNGTVYEMDASSGQVARQILLVPERQDKTKLRTIQRVILSPDQTTLAASCDPVYFLVDLQTWQVLQKVPVSHKIISGVAFSPDGRFLATSDIRASGIIEIFDLLKPE
jgi:WD40 repeat protein